MAAKRKSSRSKKDSPGAQELLVLELQEIHNAENQLSRMVPRFAKVVESEALRKMTNERLAEGERIIQDIEKVFDELDESPGRKKNIAAEGLLADAREHVQEIEPGPALDAVLIGAIQKTEHYCIAAWGTARALAEATGQKAAAKAMQRALDEGKEFDERLTELAEKEVTPALLSGSEEQVQGEDEEEQGGQNGSGRSRKRGGSEGRVS